MISVIFFKLLDNIFWWWPFLLMHKLRCWSPKDVQWVYSVKKTKQIFRRGWTPISVLGQYSLSVKRDF